MPLTKSPEGSKKNEDVDLQELSSITHGFVGADLEGLCKEAAMKTLRRMIPGMKLQTEKLSSDFLNQIEVTMCDFREAFKDVMPSTMREVYVEVPDVSWSDIGGLETIKKE